MATAAATPSKLSDIIKYRRKQGGGVAGSLAGGIKEKLKEKFDPRQMFNQQGILTALFPGLKAFKATTAPKQELSDKISPSISFDEIVPVLNKINANTRILSKNMMVLPAMHRDINVMRQNIGKLVKLRGASATTKADMYFMKAKERESLYEEQFKKVSTKPTMIPTGGKENAQDESPGLVSQVLSGIIGAISSLGSAILKVFTTLGSIVKGLLVQLGQAIFRVLITTIGGFLAKSIADFIKNLGLSALIFKVVRLVLGRVLWPAAIAAAAYVAGEYIKENPFDFIDESNVGLSANTLPMPDIAAGEEVALGATATKPIKGWQGRPIKLENPDLYKPQIAEELKTGKKKLYMLFFPGLIQRASIPLSDDEAQDLAKKYTALLSAKKQRDALSKESKPDPIKISNADAHIGELTANIRNIYRNSYVNSLKPELLTNENVSKFVDMMDRKIKYPEMGPIESRIAKKVDSTMDSISQGDLGQFTPDLEAAGKRLEEELGKIKIDPNQFTPQLTPSGDKDSSGTQIQQKTSEVKDSKQSAVTPQADTKVSSLSSQQQTSSVSHVGENASPWNVDLIENLLTGGRNVMVG
jgi:hypothetical protein